MLLFPILSHVTTFSQESFRPVFTVGNRKPTEQERGYMLQYSGKTPDKGASEYLSKNDWEILENGKYALFIDNNTSQYGRLLKKFRFHLNLFNHFEKFPDGNGYAAPEFSKELITIFSQFRHKPAASFASRVTIAREVRLSFMLHSNHRQDFYTFTSSQVALQQPYLQTEEPFQKIEQYWIPTWSIPKEFSETVSRVSIFEQTGSPYKLLGTVYKDIDFLTTTLLAKDKILKSKLINQATSSDKSLKALLNLRKEIRLQSAPIYSRAVVNDHLRKSDPTALKQPFYSSATFAPRSLEYVINLEHSSRHYHERYSLNEIFESYR